MSIYIDAITFLWALTLLMLYAQKPKTLMNNLAFSAVAVYLLAQSGWTTAYLVGDEWGRDLSNFMWFVFNGLVLSMITLMWCRNGRG